MGNVKNIYLAMSDIHVSHTNDFINVILTLPTDEKTQYKHQNVHNVKPSTKNAEQKDSHIVEYFASTRPVAFHCVSILED